jgi:hypothetical protein
VVCIAPLIQTQFVFCLIQTRFSQNRQQQQVEVFVQVLLLVLLIADPVQMHLLHHVLQMVTAQQAEPVTSMQGILPFNLMMTSTFRSLVAM